ncbi:uncharacterized protein CDAR_165891 [Caerostris darwini]|uniref:Uncharacterized protein n=1 Tax=Caerostris darwini TaxID=1538125 RepID=A0AAV4RU64_9ARAC|nr:uncharacterized protein CDAR_165891 [Caerostris darwini]
MYYNRSRSPAPYSERSFSPGLSYSNYSSDLTSRSFSPRNRSVQRVLDTDFGRLERSRSPVRDHSLTRTTALRPLTSSTLSGDISPGLRRKELGLTSQLTSDSRGSPVNWLGGDDFRKKPRSYYDFPTHLSSYTPSVIKKPQRIDYSDYFRPTMQSRPMLRSDFKPKPRAERDKEAMPIVRERKLIKFREITNDILNKVKRKVSWDLPAEIQSPLINELRSNENTISERVIAESARSRDSSLTRHDSKETIPRENSLTRYSPKEPRSRECSLTRYGSPKPESYPEFGSPSASTSRRYSDQSIDPMSPRNLMRLKSRSKESDSLEGTDSPNAQMDIDLTCHPKIVPPPRKKSLGALPRIKKHRKSSIENIAAEEKSLSHSIIADQILRRRESADTGTQIAENALSLNASKPPDISENDTCNTENLELAEIEPSNTEIKPEHLPRRRRRTSDVSQQNTEDAKTRRRNRTRPDLIDLSHEDANEIPSPSEAPRPINRMHRKSVKYKMDKCSNRRLSKGFDEDDQISTLLPALYGKDSLVNENQEKASFVPANLVSEDKKELDKPKRMKNRRKSRSLSGEKLSQLLGNQLENENNMGMQKDKVSDSQQNEISKGNKLTNILNSIQIADASVDTKELKHLQTIHTQSANVCDENTAKIHLNKVNSIPIPETKNNSLDTKIAETLNSKSGIEKQIKPSTISNDKQALLKGSTDPDMKKLETDKSIQNSSIGHEVKTNLVCSKIADVPSLKANNVEKQIAPSPISNLKTEKATNDTVVNKTSKTSDAGNIKMSKNIETLKSIPVDISFEEDKLQQYDKNADTRITHVKPKNNKTLLPEQSNKVTDKVASNNLSSDLDESKTLKSNIKIKNISLDKISSDKKILTSNKTRKEPLVEYDKSTIASPAVISPDEMLLKSSINGGLSNKNDQKKLITSINDAKIENVPSDSAKLSVSSKTFNKESVSNKNQSKNDCFISEVSSKSSTVKDTSNEGHLTCSAEDKISVSHPAILLPQNLSSTGVNKDKIKAALNCEPVKPKPLEDKKIDNACLDLVKSGITKEVRKDEEIVVVCKLPQPKKPPPVQKSSIDNDTNKIIPIDQNVVVSIVNSKTVLVSEKKPDESNKTMPSSAISIPNKQILATSSSNLAVTSDEINIKNKIQSGPSRCSVHVAHTVVLKPKSPNSGSSAQQLKSDSKTTVSTIRLKAIPDVVQSAIKTNSKVVSQSNDSNNNSISNNLIEKSTILPNIKKAGDDVDVTNISPKNKLPVKDVPDLMKNVEKSLEREQTPPKLHKKDNAYAQEILPTKVNITIPVEKHESSSKPDLIKLKDDSENSRTKKQIINNKTTNDLSKVPAAKKDPNSEFLLNSNEIKTHENKCAEVKKMTEIVDAKKKSSGTIKPYKKSLTLPDVNVSQDVSNLSVPVDTSKPAKKDKNVASLSSDNVPVTLLEAGKVFKKECKDIKKILDLSNEKQQKPMPSLLQMNDKKKMLHNISDVQNDTSTLLTDTKKSDKDIQIKQISQNALQNKMTCDVKEHKLAQNKITERNATYPLMSDIMSSEKNIQVKQNSLEKNSKITIQNKIVCDVKEQDQLSKNANLPLVADVKEYGKNKETKRTSVEKESENILRNKAICDLKERDQPSQNKTLQSDRPVVADIKKTEQNIEAKQASLETGFQNKTFYDIKKTDELTKNKLTAQNDKCPAATAINKSDQKTEAKQAGLEKISQSKIVCDVKKTDELPQSKLTAQNDKCSAATDIKKSDQNTEAKQAGLEKIPQSKIVCDVKKTDELAQSKLTAQNDKCPTATAIKKSDKNTEAKEVSLEKSSQSKIVCDTKKTDELTPNKITVQNDKLPLVTDIKKSEKSVETKQTLEKKPENTFQNKAICEVKEHDQSLQNKKAVKDDISVVTDIKKSATIKDVTEPDQLSQNKIVQNDKSPLKIDIKKSDEDTQEKQTSLKKSSQNIPQGKIECDKGYDQSPKNGFNIKKKDSLPKIDNSAAITPKITESKQRVLTKPKPQPPPPMRFGLHFRQPPKTIQESSSSDSDYTDSSDSESSLSSSLTSSESETETSKEFIQKGLLKNGNYWVFLIISPLGTSFVSGRCTRKIRLFV